MNRTSGSNESSNSSSCTGEGESRASFSMRSSCGPSHLGNKEDIGPASPSTQKWLPKIIKRLSRKGSKETMSDVQETRASIRDRTFIRPRGSFLDEASTTRTSYSCSAELMTESQEFASRKSDLAGIYDGSNASDDWKDFVFEGDDDGMCEDDEETAKWYGVVQT